jgi:hypothetical protein
MKTIKTLQLAALMAALPLGAWAGPEAAGATHEKSWSGTLTDVNAGERTITARKWFIKRTFNAGDKCTVKAVGKKEAALGDLRPGEEVIIHYRDADGVLVADRITERPLHYQGTIETVDAKTSQLTMAAGRLGPASHHKQMQIASDCKILLHNGKAGTVADLHPGDRVTIIYELPDGSPTAYQVSKRTTEFVGTLDAIDLGDRTVKAKETFGQKKFNLADGCQIALEGRSDASLKDLALGQRYEFTYENVNGVNVVNRIAPAQAATATETAAAK